MLKSKRVCIPKRKDAYRFFSTNTYSHKGLGSTVSNSGLCLNNLGLSGNLVTSHLGIDLQHCDALLVLHIGM